MMPLSKDHQRFTHPKIKTSVIDAFVPKVSGYIFVDVFQIFINVFKEANLENNVSVYRDFLLDMKFFSRTTWKLVINNFVSSDDDGSSWMMEGYLL